MFSPPTLTYILSQQSRRPGSEFLDTFPQHGTPWPGEGGSWSSYHQPPLLFPPSAPTCTCKGFLPVREYSPTLMSSQHTHTLTTAGSLEVHTGPGGIWEDGFGEEAMWVLGRGLGNLQVPLCSTSCRSWVLALGGCISLAQHTACPTVR